MKGSGFSHQEKNWGQAFPSGHVWLQAMSPDNKFQVMQKVQSWETLVYIQLNLFKGKKAS
jgi:hypothetical protein